MEINSCHTLKPFDLEGLKKDLKNLESIIIIEDHSEIGGLNNIVKTAAYEDFYSG